MRRIEEVAEPKRWAVEDHKAGIGPDIDCKATYIPEAFNVKQCTVLFIDKLRERAPYYIATDDGWRGFVSLSTLSPIETPDEKAARLENEFYLSVKKDWNLSISNKDESFELGVRAAYRRLNGELPPVQAKDGV